MRIVSLAALWVCSKQCAAQPRRHASGVCGSAARAELLVRELVATGAGNPPRQENAISAARYLRGILSYSVCARLVTTVIPKPLIGTDANIATRKETGFTYGHVRSGRAPVPDRR